MELGGGSTGLSPGPRTGEGSPDRISTLSISRNHMGREGRPPSGTMVWAVIDGVQQGSASTGAGGSYILHVSQGSGTNISFMVDTLTAEETAS